MINFLFNLSKESPLAFIFVVIGITIGFGVCFGGIILFLKYVPTKQELKKDFEIINDSFNRATKEIDSMKENMKKIDSKIDSLGDKLLNKIIEASKESSYLRGKVEK